MDDIPMFPYDPDNHRKSILDNVDIIHRRTVESIDIGYNAGLDMVTLFQMGIPIVGNKRFLNLPNSMWEENLEMALEYFEGIEDYEMCSYTKDVLGRITE
jgi:hypothetical protein|tara:strand:+ start:101 stop:400 length:300 start_codon:yes stop_codon:yes gene_type:complete